LVLVGAPANVSAKRANAIVGKGRCNNVYFFLNQLFEIIDCPTLTATLSKVPIKGENPIPQTPDSLHSLALEGVTSNLFWLVVPTYNPGLQDWAQWLQAFQAQQNLPARVVVVDSGSTDGSLALTQQVAQDLATQLPPFTLLHVQATQFDHGGTRQWALDQALQAHPQNLPHVVVFMTQDAILANPHALGNLISAFQNSHVAAAFGRQLPKPQAEWLEVHARHFNYPAQSRTVQLQDKASLGLKACFFSNAFGAYRLSALKAQAGLPAKLPLGEDTFTAAKFLLSGQSLHYQADAAVYHSHHYNGRQDFQRMFDTGVFHAQNPWLLQSFGSAQGEGCRLLRAQWVELKRLTSSHPSANVGISGPQVPSMLRGFLQMVFTNSIKLCGYKMGQWHRYLPNFLNQRLSMHKSFWQRQA
jgi:rhamnosyltransferase